MPPSRTAEAALLKWVNTFPLDSNVESLAELTDGRVLSKMLEDLDKGYAVENLENINSASKWLAKKSSLEAFYKSLLRYIRIQCLDLDPIALEDPVDFNAIAEHEDVEQTIKLLTILLLAAVHGTNKEKYVQAITRLDLESQAEIATIIQKTLSGLDAADSKPVNETLPPKITQDIELALEEEHAKLVATHNELKKKHADYISRFSRLEESHAELQEHSRDIESQLRLLQESNDDDKADYIKDLKAKLQEANDLIANQEQEAETNRITKERQERELHTLRPSAQRLIEIEDRLNELKVENTTLARKANKVDHYQKKLENLQGIENQNAHFREQIETLELNMRDYDKINEDKSKLEQTIREQRSLMANLESENITLIMTNRNLDEDKRFREDQIRKLTERQQHDERFIKELQEQMSTDVAGPSPPSPSTGGNARLTLDQELEQSDDPTPNYALEISRLRAENQLLKSNGGGTTSANLRVDLEEADRIRKRLQENLQDLTEKHAVKEQQLSAALSNSNSEKDDAFSKLNRLHMETSSELLTLKSKLAETESKLSRQERELLEAKTDLEAMNRDEMDALEVLKETNELITTSLQNDLQKVQNDYRNITTDFEQQKTHLLQTLLAKEQLMKDLADARDKAAAGGEKVQPDDSDKEVVRKSQEQIQKQEQMIADLQRRLKQAEEQSPDAQKAASESMIKNLTRENALIASAWYDLSSRLQSNHLVLQRRQDAPRSWLNKQRQMVANSTPKR